MVQDDCKLRVLFKSAVNRPVFPIAALMNLDIAARQAHRIGYQLLENADDGNPHQYGKYHREENRRYRNQRAPLAAPHIPPCQFQVHHLAFFMFWVVKKSTLMGWLKTALL